MHALTLIRIRFLRYMQAISVPRKVIYAVSDTPATGTYLKDAGASALGPCFCLSQRPIEDMPT